MILRSGRADIVLAGGSEAPLMPMTFAGFNALRVMSTRNDSPHTASRPFDKTRDGFVMGEGAGILVLETEFNAKRRGATIYAELAGYGATSGAFHPVAPLDTGADAASAIELALSDAQVDKKDVDYINAHGTATLANDLSETRAIKIAFGKHAYEIPSSSTKSMTGHLIGAAGAVEAAFTALAIHHKQAPPTTNQFDADPECDLQYVPNVAISKNIEVAISNAFGFGNNNAVLVLKKYL